MPTAHISNDSGRPITIIGREPKSRPRSISAIRRGIKEAGRSMANMHRKMIGRMMRGGRGSPADGAAACPTPCRGTSSSMNSMAMIMMVRVS